MKKVLIVEEGQWGSVKPEDYKKQVEKWRRQIDGLGIPNSQKGEIVMEKAAEVVVVEKTEQAEALVKRGGISVVIFISRSMGPDAQTLASKYPETRVMVFTGLIPEGQVIWLNKWWLVSGDVLRDVILVH